jgi:hypothetical protein
MKHEYSLIKNCVLKIAIWLSLLSCTRVRKLYRRAFISRDIPSDIFRCQGHNKGDTCKMNTLYKKSIMESPSVWSSVITVMVLHKIRVFSRSFGQFWQAHQSMSRARGGGVAYYWNKCLLRPSSVKIFKRVCNIRIVWHFWRKLISKKK